MLLHNATAYGILRYESAEAAVKLIIEAMTASPDPKQWNTRDIPVRIQCK